MTFDQIYEDKERQLTMADHRDALSKSKVKSLKQQQMKASIRSIKSKLKTANDAYIASVTTEADSVTLKMQADKLDEQLRLAEDMYASLFYGRVRRFFINLLRWISRK